MVGKVGHSRPRDLPIPEPPVSSLVAQVGPALLQAMAPKAPNAKVASQRAIIAKVGTALSSTLARYEITTALRIGHFTAQAAHESDGFCTTEEYASGTAYEGRADLGNTQPGDGRRYKGRGIFQLTGRANYRRFGLLLGVDLEASPERAAEPALSLEIACLFWREKNLNAAADDDDLILITRRINGGRNGLDDRRRYLGIAKRELAALAASSIVSPDPEHYPVLRRGSEGDAVEDLQARLRKKGFPVTLDGDFGPATELAVRALQSRAGLKPDGIVGPKSWAVLVERT